MDSYLKFFAIIIACTAIATPLTNSSDASAEKAKAGAWGQCVTHHPVVDCKDQAP